MRILCCLNRDLASNIALNLLLPTFRHHQVSVVLTERVAPRNQTEEPPQRRELRIAEQAIPNEILYPLIERANFPDDGTRYLTFSEVERHRGIQVRPLSKPNVGDGLKAIQDLAPDLVLTIRYGAILKPPVISIPRFGVLNLHSGLLPDYRGILATFRALVRQDAEVGCTLHYITDGTIDTGSIVETARIAVTPGQSLLGHVLALYPPGTAMVAAAVDRLESGKPISARPQDRSAGSYHTWPSAEEWADFTRLGWEVAQPGDLDGVARRYLPQQTNAC